MTFVVNPVAKKGRSGKVWQRLAVELRESGHAFDVLYTERKGDGYNKARLAVERGASRVISVGGDGTIQEIVNAVKGHNIDIGLVPLGTGNDFARTVGIPSDPGAAARLALTGVPRPIDLGRIDGRLFTNAAGIGFDAEVANEANKSGLILSGTVTYFVSVLKTLWRYRCSDVSIEIDGRKWQQRILLIAVGNGRYYGGGMMIAPEAQIDDGLFDIIVAGDLTVAETLSLLPKVYSGAHVHHPKARTYRGKKVTIESRDPLTVQADGEVIGGTPVTFEIMEGALRLVR